jgi:hypothetical protein
VLLLALLLVLSCRDASPVTEIALSKPPPSSHTSWPWAEVAEVKLHNGVRLWEASQVDGTTLHLIRFDFDENPRLALRIYDQDEDDAKPRDNQTDFHARSSAHVTRDLNAKGSRVVAAWNGLFFGYDRSKGSPPQGWAKHIGPVVLDGEVLHNVGRHRWTFGVKSTNGKPAFKALHKPSKQTLAQEFDFAAEGAQLLLNEGKPLKLEPFPATAAEIREPPVDSTPEEAGHIPIVDHMKTSRTSMAWSQDNRFFYLLVVNEPDTENAAKMALKRGTDDMTGWTLEDLQRFWLSFGAWGAVNSDGGVVTQLVWRRQDGRYEMLPPRTGSASQRLLLEPDFSNAPSGGTLLTFYVSEDP